MSRGPNAAVLLERAILAHAARCGLAARVSEARSTPWASATFAGARHRLVLEVGGNAREWIDGLSEADLPIRLHLVADLAVSRVEDGEDSTRAELEVLTVEDR